jgi:hypothetical protein
MIITNNFHRAVGNNRNAAAVGRRVRDLNLTAQVSWIRFYRMDFIVLVPLQSMTLLGCLPETTLSGLIQRFYFLSSC